MADPFSIVAGAIGIIDVCCKVGVYLRDVQKGAEGVEEDIKRLSKEIADLASVSDSITQIANKERTLFLNDKFADKEHLKDLWLRVSTQQSGCQEVLENLERLLANIVGNHGQKVVGRMDGIRKQLRKQSKDGEMAQIRLKLSSYQSGLQAILTVLNLCYTRISFESNDDSAAQLSDSIKLMDYKLQAQLASLRPRLALIGDDKLCDSIDSVTKPLMSLNVHFNIPHAVNSLFTGRDIYLRDLKKSLDDAMEKDDSTQKRFVLYGLGGSGKTEFCCKFAQENRQSFWGIFWIDASSPHNAKHSFASIAKIGGVEPNERAAKSWLSSLDRPWLLLIDNADDPLIHVEDYFPPGERGFILITTRNPRNRYLGTIGAQHFDKMQADEASDLLLKASEIARPWSAVIRQQAALITEALGFLPLALISAGTAILERLCTLADYIPYFKRSWERIREQRSLSGLNTQSDDESTMHVYSSYEIIYLGLEAKKSQTSRDAIQLLKVFSFLHYENIQVRFITAAGENRKREQESQADTDEGPTMPKSWLQLLRDFSFKMIEVSLRDRTPPVLPDVLRNISPTSSFDLDRINLALRVLSQMSMITYQEGNNCYSMHPLVHTWVRERPQNTIAEQAIWCEAAVATLAQCVLIPPLGMSEEDEALKRDLLPHVVQAEAHRIDIASKFTARQARRTPIIPRASPMLSRQKILQAVKFSLVYAQSGKWEEAANLQVMVKDYLCARLGVGHPLTMKVMLALSGIYWSQTKAKEAADLQSQVLQACISTFGPEHAKTLKAMDTLGATRCLQGRFKESHELHEKAVQGMTKVHGLKHEDTLLAMNNFGRIKWMYFQYEDAKSWYLKAVAGMREVLGKHHLETLFALENLSMTYLDLGNPYLQLAHDQMEEVLGARKEKLGKEAPWTLLAICNLGRVKSALGHTAEAERMMREAIPIAERDLGEDHFGTLAGKVHYAQVLVRMGRYDDAEEIFTKVVERQRYAAVARDDGEHPDRILAMNYLMRCYQLHGKVEEAIAICDELTNVVQTIGGQGLGKHHIFAKKLDKKREELLGLRELLGSSKPREESKFDNTSSKERMRKPMRSATD